MSPMMLLFFYFVGINSAVIVDSVDSTHKGPYDTENPTGWQMFKMYHPPGAQAVVKYESFAYPKYEFEYAVSDKTTGDHKHHYESRDGHKVRGEYGLVEADGSLRNVQYNADDFNGFNAVVSKTVNKHGNSAYSVIGHTRQFLPIGQDVKINHFFPSKDYHYQEPAKTNEDASESKPMQETPLEPSVVPSIENQVVEEKQETLVLPEPTNAYQPNAISVEHQPIKILESPIIKMDAVEGPSFKVLPLPVVPENHKTHVDAESITQLPITEKSVILVSNDNIHKHKEEELGQKEEHHSDSEVASSYYHSKVYYVGF